MRPRTYSQTQSDALKSRGWRVFDAKDQVLGRFASRLADVLRGKDKPTFTPSMDGGDFVVVINASKVKLTGAKLDGKIYYDHTGYRGGLVERTAREVRNNDPEEMVRRAVWGMLPKGPLGRKIINKLKIYSGDSHPHSAQEPKVLEVQA